MRVNLKTDHVAIDFFDGYLYRFLQELRDTRGLKETGLAEYYGHRLDARIGGLIEYEEAIARFLLDAFKSRPVVHVGMGVGTLTCFMAVNGMRVTGVEADVGRIESARHIRKAVSAVWPATESRYEIVQGLYPAAAEGKAWVSRDSVLLFTNAANTWGDEMLSEIIESMSNFGDAFLDLRCFGAVRETESERAALFDRIASRAIWAERLPHVAGSSNVHFSRFVFAN